MDGHTSLKDSVSLGTCPSTSLSYLTGRLIGAKLQLAIPSRHMRALSVTPMLVQSGENVIKLSWPHRNLGAFGITIGRFYFDITFPPKEGWGWSWKELFRIYWKSRRTGEPCYLYLPNLRFATKRFDGERRQNFESYWSSVFGDLRPRAQAGDHTRCG